MTQNLVVKEVTKNHAGYPAASRGSNSLFLKYVSDLYTRAAGV